MIDKKTSVKKRNWAFVVYPSKNQLDELGSKYNGVDGYGSLPDDWKSQLQLSGLQIAISPLHDKDINADGVLKKPHWHLIAVYGSPTTYNNVKCLTERLNAPSPQALEQIRGYYRYLTHKDNPDKFQYRDEDINSLNGFNIFDFVEISKSEVLEIKFKLHELIREKDFIEYEDFMDYVQLNLDRTFYDVSCNNTMFFNTYLKSRRYSRGQFKKFKVDTETGEVLCDLQIK